MRCRFYTLFLCGFVLLSEAELAAAESIAPQGTELRWRAAILDPWLYKDDGGTYQGVMFELIQSFSRAAGLQLNVSEGAPRRLLVDVMESDADLVILPYVFIPPESDFAFHDKLYCNQILFRSGIYAFALTSQFGHLDKELENFNDFKVLTRYIPDYLISAYLGEANYSITVAPADSMMKSLIAGRADVVVHAGVGGYTVIKRLGISDKITTIKTLPPMTYHMCFNRAYFASQTQLTEKDLPEVVGKMANDSMLKENIKAIVGDVDVITISEKDLPL